MSRRLSVWSPIIALGMVVTGVLLGCIGAQGAFVPQLIRYTFGDRGPGVGDIRSQLPAATHSDLWLIAAYGMVLAGCALFYRARASSRSGCHVANFVTAAVVIAVLADLIEDYLLSRGSDDAWLSTATAAAATIKFCMIAVAAVGLLAAVGIVLRGLMGTYQAWAWHHSHGVPLSQMLRHNLFGWTRVGASDASQPKPWWDEVLAADDFPKPAATDGAVVHSGQTVDALVADQQSWLRAYNVPGISEALRGRTEPLRALCLACTPSTGAAWRAPSRCAGHPRKAGGTRRCGIPTRNPPGCTGTGG